MKHFLTSVLKVGIIVIFKNESYCNRQILCNLLVNAVDLKENTPICGLAKCVTHVSQA